MLRWYREFMPAAPEDVYGFFAFLTVPPAPPFPEELHLQKMCGIVWCCTGARRPGRAALAAAVGEPARRRSTGCTSFRTRSFKPHSTRSTRPASTGTGRATSWPRSPTRRSSATSSSPRRCRRGSPACTFTRSTAPPHRVGSDDTAFSYRDATWSMVMAGIDPDPAKADALRAWATAYWEALHPHSMDGAYVNFMMEEGDERVRATYRDNYERLAEIKAELRPRQPLPGQPEHRTGAAQGRAGDGAAPMIGNAAERMGAAPHWR